VGWAGWAAPRYRPGALRPRVAVWCSASPVALFCALRAAAAHRCRWGSHPVRAACRSPWGSSLFAMFIGCDCSLPNVPAFAARWPAGWLVGRRGPTPRFRPSSKPRSRQAGSAAVPHFLFPLPLGRRLVLPGRHALRPARFGGVGCVLALHCWWCGPWPWGSPTPALTLPSGSRRSCLAGCPKRGSSPAAWHHACPPCGSHGRGSPGPAACKGLVSSERLLRTAGHPRAERRPLGDRCLRPGGARPATTYSGRRKRPRKKIRLAQAGEGCASSAWTILRAGWRSGTTVVNPRNPACRLPGQCRPRPSQYTNGLSWDASPQTWRLNRQNSSGRGRCGRLLNRYRAALPKPGPASAERPTVRAQLSGRGRSVSRAIKKRHGPLVDGRPCRVPPATGREGGESCSPKAHHPLVHPTSLRACRAASKVQPTRIMITAGAGAPMQHMLLSR